MRRPYFLRSRLRQPADHVVHHPGQDPREQDGIAQAQVHQARQVLLEPQEEEERFDLRIKEGANNFKEMCFGKNRFPRKFKFALKY